MFYKSRKETGLEAAVMMAELTYHSIARKIRNTHGNAVLSILVNLLQLMIMVIAFYAMFTLLGLRSVAVRGDFMLYLMSGIFLYMTHAKTLGAVVGSEGPTSAMMLHAPMNTIIAIMSSVGMVTGFFLNATVGSHAALRSGLPYADCSSRCNS